jgi:3-hydroxyisobutyrate dehydrogenase-like beta-hydroxyacid dehydrogenase
MGLAVGFIGLGKMGKPMARNLLAGRRIKVTTKALPAPSVPRESKPS